MPVPVGSPALDHEVGDDAVEHRCRRRAGVFFSPVVARVDPLLLAGGEPDEVRHGLRGVLGEELHDDVALLVLRVAQRSFPAWALLIQGPPEERGVSAGDGGEAAWVQPVARGGVGGTASRRPRGRARRLTPRPLGRPDDRAVIAAEAQERRRRGRRHVTDDDGIGREGKRGTDRSKWFRRWRSLVVTPGRWLFAGRCGLQRAPGSFLASESSIVNVSRAAACSASFLERPGPGRTARCRW